MFLTRVRRAVAGGLVALLTIGTLVAVASPANAADVGTLAITPANGADTTPIIVSMSGPCPGGTNLVVRISGAGFPLAGYNVVANSRTSIYPINPAGGQEVPLQNTLGFFASQQSPPATLNGDYVLRLTCKNNLAAGGPTNEGFGDFIGRLNFTTPTTYAVVDNDTATTISAGPTSPQTAGTVVTFTANVTADDGSLAAGSVQFLDGATALGAAQPVPAGVSGTAAFSTAALSVGSHSITAVFSSTAGPQTGSTSAALTYVVEAAPALGTVTTISASPASPQLSGSSITFSANVTADDGSLEAGSVQFKDGAANLGAAQPVAAGASGTATLTTAALSVGAHSITAVFTSTAGPQTNSTSGPLPYTINAAAAVDTTTTLGLTPSSPRPVGTSVTFTATVSPAAAGTVQFRNGASDLGSPVAVVSGVAEYTSALPAGTYSVRAFFSPADSAAFNASNSTSVAYEVSSTATTTTISAAPATTQVAGLGVTFTANITAADASLEAGTVQFKDGATNVGAAQPVAAGASGTASITTNLLAVGPHSIKAVFTSTAGPQVGSESAALDYSITAAAQNTSTALSVPATVTAGVPVSLTATVTAGSGTPVGSVAFFDGAAAIGSGAVNGSGVATTSATFAAGAHSVTATFTPTSAAAFNPSTSSASTFTAAPAVGTAVTVTASPVGPSIQGVAITFTAHITADDSSLEAGSVQFKDGGVELGGPQAVSAGAIGTATVATSALTVGTHLITAVFTSTAGPQTGSSSAARSYVINAPAATSVSIAAAPLDAAVFGSPVTFTATLSPAAAAGTIQFKDGSADVGGLVSVASGVASITTSALSEGAHAITAVFVPANPLAFLGSTSPGLGYQSVKPLVTTTTLVASPAGGSIVGSPVELTATVFPTATGNIQFKDGSASLGSVAVVEGVARLTTSDLAIGTHSLTAIFTPPSLLTHTRSTSAALPFAVLAPPVATTTTISATPSSPKVVGTAVTFKAIVAGVDAAGTVQFKNGEVNLGTAVDLAAGAASLISSTLPVGTHSISAVFVPANAAAFSTSTSAAISYVITAPVVTTATTIAAAPASPQVAGTSVTFAAGVSGSGAAGTVQFKDGGANLGSAVALAGGSASLTTSALTAGAHSIAAVFTPTNPAAFTGSTSGVLSYTITAPSPVMPLPVNVAKPVVIGAMRVGTPANCLQDKWSGTPTYTRQWLRNGKPIAKATDTKYRIVVADLGTMLSCTVTATNAGGSSSATSGARKVAIGKFISVALPIVVGKIKAGQKLQAVVGPWGDDAPVVIRYQWKSGRNAIRGAAAGSYLVKVADVGRVLAVTVTVSRPGFAPVSVTSVVILGQLPKIVGRVLVGQTLSVPALSWSTRPSGVRFQWYRNGKVIAKATKSSYKVTVADKGAKLTVRIIGLRGRLTVATVTTGAVVVAKR